MQVDEKNDRIRKRGKEKRERYREGSMRKKERVDSR
jgi:hypothetical protein